MFSIRTIRHSSSSEMKRQVIIIAIVRRQQRLIHKGVQMDPEGEIQEIEVLGARRPSNMSSTFSPPPEICSIKVITRRSRKLCWSTIVREPYVLEINGRYSLQRLQEKWKICKRESFFNPITVL
ncbi:hypothetical protein TNCV_717671 [Trichonephila clavipes]|nr:hypothetical protein TNCV_717671 [Trichonephila clavipes]